MALDLTSLIIALNPPKLLDIFDQVNIYNIITANTIPILTNITLPSTDKHTTYATTFTKLNIHFALYLTNM
jgi:hypothetical protein